MGQCTITAALGSTNLEPLVVVSTIALLLSILLPAIGKARDNARVTMSRSNLRQLGVRGRDTLGKE
ncbi:MAG: hypothetical protein ACYTGF_03845 [Planctomycetota bacterium]|jgi:hypothetical protein